MALNFLTKVTVCLQDWNSKAFYVVVHSNCGFSKSLTLALVLNMGEVLGKALIPCLRSTIVIMDNDTWLNSFKSTRPDICCYVEEVNFFDIVCIWNEVTDTSDTPFPNLINFPCLLFRQQGDKAFIVLNVKKKR